KMDMVPGRTNRLTLHPTKTGTYRGACAEYCGDAHALMSFYAVVMERDEFDGWLGHQADSASTPLEPHAERGAALFLENGCGACHTVRGTEADGRIGPDLTHVGGRVSVGGGILPNDAAGFERWLRQTEHVKPGVFMPSFGMLPDDQLRAIAAYLDALR
ncbi:MAG TPA: c-type cytochrome, partial [Rhodothermales bacterium]